MGEFFKGWRRKVGVVTLGLACVFAGAWVHSLTTYADLTRLSVHGDCLGGFWRSRNGTIEYVTYRVKGRPNGDGMPSSIRVTLHEEVERSISYWSLTIPLRLLSAWLLLSKQPLVKAKMQA
jgi:hypothetical protein